MKVGAMHCDCLPPRPAAANLPSTNTRLPLGLVSTKSTLRQCPKARGKSPVGITVQ